MLALIFVGLGAKFQLIERHGSPLPYLDQWDGEAAAIYVPYLEHQLSPADFFRPNNEHRIVFTDVYNLALLVLNGQWDPELQMVVNVIIHCVCLAGFGWLMATLLGWGKWPWIWALLAASLVLPFGWENVLWGFQSQFYFLLIASMLTIWLLGTGEERSRKWWSGVAAGCLALFTMATGFMAAAAVACVVLLEIARERRQWRQQWRTLAVCSLIILAGLLLKVHVQRLEVLKAESVQAFLLSLGRGLAWPSVLHPWLAGLNLLPLIVLAWRFVRSQGKPGVAERLLLGIGFWAVMQSLAIAYARGGAGNLPSSRYMDIGSFLMIGNGLSIVLLLAQHGDALRPARLWWLAFALWTGGVAWGLYNVTVGATRISLPWWDQRQDVRLANARAFMATDDPRVFDNQGVSGVSFYYLPELVFLMRSPDIRTNLPTCVREPLKVQPTAAEGFVTNGWLPAMADAPTERSWGSYSAAAGVRTRRMFESQPVKASSLPYLEIPVAGDLGARGTSLELVEAGTGTATPVRPEKLPGARWVNVRVKAPPGPFKIVARDESDAQWFAFKEPREMGRLSCWAAEMVARWRWFLWAGAACLVWSITSLWARQRKPGSA